MLDEPEVIRQEMQETRTALTDKLETLEQQVMNTVSDATSAVTDTVDSVKEAIEDTVATVTGTVQDSVTAVKNTFDLPRQMDRHPWLCLGASVAVGYLGGRLLGGMASYSRPVPSRQASVPPARTWPSQATNGAGTYQNSSGPEPSAPPPPPQREGPGWLSTLASQLTPEIARLKSLAIGTALGLGRDVLVQSVPDELVAKLTELANDFTAKLGGEVMRGSLLTGAAASGASKEAIRPTNEGNGSR